MMLVLVVVVVVVEEEEEVVVVVVARRGPDDALACAGWDHVFISRRRVGVGMLFLCISDLRAVETDPSLSSQVPESEERRASIFTMDG